MALLCACRAGVAAVVLAFLAAAGLGASRSDTADGLLDLCVFVAPHARPLRQPPARQIGLVTGGLWGSADARQLPILDQTALMASSAAFVRLGRRVRGRMRRWLQTRAGSAVGNGGTAARMRCHARSAAPGPGRGAQISWRALTRSGSGEL